MVSLAEVLELVTGLGELIDIIVVQSISSSSS